MTKYKNKRDQKTLLEVIFLSLFKSIWWLLKYPFGGKKKNTRIIQSDKNFIINKRQEIETLLESNNSIDLTHALIESDKLLDHIFKLYGYPGESFADRLKFAENKMDQRTYNRLWHAHKLRNQLVHETDHNLKNQEIKIATEILIQYIKNV